MKCPSLRPKPLGGAVGLFALCQASVAAADASPARAPTAVRVEYAAPATCPTQADFEARVRARTELARFVPDGDAQLVRIVVRPNGFNYAGHLAIVAASGQMRDRDVEDTECSEVIDALALVTALAIDPAALLVPRAAPPVSPETTPILPLAPPLVPASAAANSPPLPQPPTPAPRPSHAPTPALSPALAPTPTPALAPTPTPTPALAPARWTPSTGAAFLLVFAVAPDALAGGGAFLDFERRTRAWLAPSFRLTATASENGLFATRQASFLLVSGRGDFCPIRLGSTDAGIRPCVAAEAGALRGQGIQISHPQSVTDPWLSVALLLRARWVPGPKWFLLEAEAGLIFPLYRPTFEFVSPTNVVDQPFAVAVSASVLAGVRFP